MVQYTVHPLTKLSHDFPVRRMMSECRTKLIDALFFLFCCVVFGLLSCSLAGTVSGLRTGPQSALLWLSTP